MLGRPCGRCTGTAGLVLVDSAHGVDGAVGLLGGGHLGQRLLVDMTRERAGGSLRASGT